MRRRAATGALAAMVMMLTVPAVSQAGTVHLNQESLGGGEYRYWLYYVAEAGEQNTLRLTQAATPPGTYGRRVVVEDSTAPVRAGDFCALDGEQKVTCDAPPGGGYGVVWGSADLLDGDDSLVTNTLATHVEAGEGNDRITGGAGEDRIYGGPGADVMKGGAERDFFLGGPGADTMDGDGDIDAIAYWDRATDEPVGVTLDGIRNDGADPNRSGISSASEEGDRDIEIEQVYGGAGPDRIRGGPGNEYLAGGDGDDLLDGRGGADSLSGDEGDDTATYANRASDAPVAVDLSARRGGADLDNNGFSSDREEGDDVRTENVIGGAGRDILIGDDVANTLNGGGGDDRLEGGRGGDLLNGGADRDTVRYTHYMYDGGVAVRLDGLRNDGLDPDGSGFSSAAEEGDRDLAVENVTGSDGPDLLRAVSDAVNVLLGGEGDDRLYTRDGGTARDQLGCGTGTDARQADPADAIGSCETRLP